MDLEELKKRLYQEKGELEARPEAPQTFEPGRRPEEGPEPFGWQAEEPVKKRSFSLGEKGKKILKFSLVGLLVALLGLAGFFVWRNFFSFDSSKVYLKIFGPERISSGEEVSYIARYRNDTRVDLQNVKITFIFPEGSLPLADQNISQIGNLPAATKDLPAIAPGQEGQLEFRANVIGLKDQQKKASVKLTYQPANLSSTFENSAEFLSTIFSVPIILDFDLPERAVSGQAFDFALKYLNTSDVSFSNLVLTVDYPQGFSFNSSLPPVNENSNTWWLSEIGPREEGEVVISGVLAGARDEVKSFKAKIGLKDKETFKLISEGQASTFISLSPLAAQLELNGTREYLANVGDELHYKITYENTVDVPINAVFIVLKFETRVLDFATLKIEKGFFNNLDSPITWNESSLPNLKMIQPGEKNTIDFSVKVKEKLPINNFNDKNFLINASVKIDSINVPISLRGTQLAGSDFLSTKLNSRLIISAKGYYYDTLMPNAGPLPPRVGQQTTYTIYWRVINLTNEVDNVVVESYLPPYIRWLDRFETNGGNIKYEKNTGKVSWSLGGLPANTGILSLVRQAVFQIGLVPGSDQIDNVVDLIKESIISGKDLFTDASLEGRAPAIQSDLPDDPDIGSDQGTVRQ